MATKAAPKRIAHSLGDRKLYSKRVKRVQKQASKKQTRVR